MRSRSLLTAAGAVAGGASLFYGGGSRLERLLNRVRRAPLPAVSAEARALHDAAFVVDLHCDSLLFGRDLTRRSAAGHVDVPRLLEGGVNLQVFASCTRIPLGFNVRRTSGSRPDVVTLFSHALRLPSAHLTPFGRAVWHAQQLHRFAAGSDGRLTIVRTRAALDALAAERPDQVGAILAVEGAMALNNDPDNIFSLHAHGYRLFGFAHFYDTEFAGSLHGVQQGGLTVRGRTLLGHLDRLGMLVDAAHLSLAAIDDVLTLSPRPIIISHGNVRGHTDSPRNLPDAVAAEVARRGGVIGIMYWGEAVGGRSARAVADALLYAVGRFGVDHVALGSDFDGAIPAPFDTSGLPVVTQLLLDAGLSAASVAKVIGGNALRVLRGGLPPAIG